MPKYSTYNDAYLLTLMEQDDERAFTALYNRYWQKLFSVSYNRLKDISSSEDIVHDVFASLWANRHDNQINSLENYLATATKFQVLSKIKKLERERNHCQSINATPVISICDESRLHHKQILQLVEKEVERLPEKCRLIFNYSRRNGLPSKEIAEKLNISPKTVDNQLHKALKQLKMITKSLFTQIFFL
jgi:RNA polymerase sigma-70 factor (family 1)